MSSLRIVSPAAGLLVALCLFTVPASAGADAALAHSLSDAKESADRKAAAPGTDFPNLDSYYPVAARRAGQDGTATVKVCVDTEGKLTQPPTLVVSSGYAAIDAGALNVATEGSGHYRPASENGVAVRGCGSFRIAFKLRGDPPVLPLDDPLFPTISGRIRELDAELGRRVGELQKRLGGSPLRPIALSAGPSSEKAIRQYARTLDSYLDEYVGITADFLDDVDYLAKSPDMPVGERVVFEEVWPDRRGAFAAHLRKVIGAMRDIVRAMDELGDYLGFSAPRKLRADDSIEGGNPDDDPQIVAIKQRAQRALETLQSAIGSTGK